MKRSNEKEFFFQEGENAEIVGAFFPAMVEKSSWWVKGKLVFVGIYKDETGNVAYCYPKYLEKITGTIEKENSYIKEHMQCIVQVIDKLRGSGKNIEIGDNIFDFNLLNSKREIERISVAKFLMRDFIINGLYQTDVVYSSVTGNGRTQWGKTVGKAIPIINNNEIIYYGAFRKRHFRDDTGEISQIHKSILFECFEFLSMRGEKRIVFIEKPKKKIDLRGSVNTLRKRLNQVFDDRERSVLKAMISWCDFSPYYQPYAGTNDFANVWEWVNDAVWGNIDNQNSTQPYYQLFGKNYLGAGQVKPDTLSVKINDNGTNCQIDIFDSKYYSPIDAGKNAAIGKEEVYGMPPSTDISKQIAYRYYIECYMNSLQSEYVKQYGHGMAIKYTNNFLIPQLKNDFVKKIVPSGNNEMQAVFECIGKVSIGSFPGIADFFDLTDKSDSIHQEFTANEMLNVQIFQVNTERLYDYYLSNPIVKISL